MLADKNKIFSARARLLVFIGATFLFFSLTAKDVNSAENNSSDSIALPTIEMPQRRLNIVKSTALVEKNLTLETVVIYDDPSTPRPQDYLEFYDRDGNLVVVAWFDRFGIQRVAVDRAFVEGEDQLEGVFVAVVDGNFI